MTLEDAIKEASLLLSPPGGRIDVTHITISADALRELYEAAWKYRDLQD